VRARPARMPPQFYSRAAGAAEPRSRRNGNLTFNPVTGKDSKKVEGSMETRGT
jgi:hypothetical protein